MSEGIENMENKKDATVDINIGELMKNSSIISYIKSSPMEAGERSTLDKMLTENYFYEKFYVHSGKAETRIKQMKKQISRDDVDALILSGSRGCGKSTFTKFFLRQTKFPNIMINFDDNWEPDVGIKKNIVMALNNRIYNDLFPQKDMEPCTIIKKYLEIFGRNNKVYIDQNNANHYFSYFTDILEHVYRLKKISINSNSVMKYYGEDIRRYTINGTIKQIMMLLIFWDIAEKIETNPKDKCLIIFENLDVVYNTEDVIDIVKNLFSLRRELAQINFVYYGNEPLRLEQNYMPLLVVRDDTKSEIVCAVSILEHFMHRFRIQNIDITALYDQKNIIEKRFQCIEKYLAENPEYKNSDNFMYKYNVIKLIAEILSDRYLNLRLSELFNYDYRSSAEMIGSLVSNDDDFMVSCKKMLEIGKKGQKWAAFGLQAIVMRKIFNLFMKEQYFASVQRFEYATDQKGVVCKINLDRMILLYLYNNRNNEGVVPLNILFSELAKFCQVNDAIAGALWQLYDMRRKYQWNSLIAFMDMRNITYEELVKEVRAFIYKESFYHFAGVKITKAGETYLNHILPHFEYYATRCRGGKGKSLFEMTAEEICDGNDLDQILKDVFAEMVDCCQKLYLFFNNIFNVTEEFQGQNFLGTAFATTVEFAASDEKYKMFYCERNIYANIEYLDRLRFYIFEILDEVLKEKGFRREINIRKTISVLTKVEHSIYDTWPKQMIFDDTCCRVKKWSSQSSESARARIIYADDKEAELPLENVITALKACLNVRLIESICSFMGMFGFYGGRKSTMYSENTPKICNELNTCINRIREAGFIDFITKIVNTGK